MSDEKPERARYKPKPRPKLPVVGKDDITGSRISRKNVLIGAKFGFLRTNKGLNQRQLSQALTEFSGMSFSKTLMSRLERGVQSPLPDEAVAICRFFDVDFEWFLSSDYDAVNDPSQMQSSYSEAFRLVRRMTPQEAIDRLMGVAKCPTCEANKSRQNEVRSGNLPTAFNPLSGRYGQAGGAKKKPGSGTV